MSMYTFKFKTATVIVIPKAVYVLAVFPDTKINEFHGRWLEGNRQYYEIAEWAGYSNWCKYALEHELTHHWLADRLGWPHSYTVYENPQGNWPKHIANEEHLVNRLQRYAYTKAQDEYGVLESTFLDLDAEILSLRLLWSRLPHL